MGDSDPKPADAMLESYLQNRTVLCPECGYDLRNLQTGRCPECGSDLELGIRLTQPRIGWLLAGLSGLVTGAGFSSLMVIFFVISTLRRPYGYGSQFWHVFSIYAFFPAAIQLALVVLYLRKWKAIRQMSYEKRRGLVLVCWAVPMVNILFFSLNIR